LNNLWSFNSLSFWWSSAPDDLQIFWWKLLMVILLLMKCFWWRQYFRSTLSSEPLFFRCFKLPTCWFHCNHLFFQNLCFKVTLNFCLWSCILEQILAYPIDNFLIHCYHQNSKGNVKHILFQQSITAKGVYYEGRSTNYEGFW